jgi:hypothetical protein
MGGDSYLEGLPPAQASRLTRVNEPGLTALRGYLADGEAAAFLGARGAASVVSAVDRADHRTRGVRIRPADRRGGCRERADHGWAARADALHARLVPAGLDPDPLATVETLVAAKKKRRRRGK